MRPGFIACVFVLLGAGLASAQPPAVPQAAPAPPVAQAAPAPALPAVAPPADGSCPGPGCFNVDGGPAPLGLFSARADYVLWFQANRYQPVALAVNASGATETLGDEHLPRHLLSGGRLSLGYWLAESNPWVPGGVLKDLGVETRFFFVGQRQVSFADVGSARLSRLFFDLNDEREGRVIVAAPGVATGALFTTAKASIWGGELDAWKLVCYDAPGTNLSLEAMAGVRYLNLDESVTVSRSSTFVANPAGFDPSFSNNRILERESLAARSQFWGGQIGARMRWYLEHAILTGTFRWAVGTTEEDVTIAGGQLRIRPNGQTTVSEGALLALPNSIGHFSRDRFTQVPEFGFEMSLPIGSHLVLSTGVTALYWGRTLRAGDQAESVVDIRQIPNFPGAATAGATAVTVSGASFHESALWLVGLTLGAEVTW